MAKDRIARVLTFANVIAASFGYKCLIAANLLSFVLYKVLYNVFKIKIFMRCAKVHSC